MIEVQPVSPSRREFAISLLLEDLPPFERRAQTRAILDASAAGELSLDFLLLAEEQREPLGVGLLVRQPDRVAFVWPPSIRSHVQEARADQVARAILLRAREVAEAGGAWLAQVMLEPEQSVERRWVADAGFERLARLQFLSLDLKAHAELATDGEQTPPGCHVVSYAELRERSESRADERLARLLEATYVDSGDCPALNAHRDGALSVVGHQQTGVFRPEWWSLLVDDSAAEDDSGGQFDAGVLILADHPDDDAAEIAYLGVAAAARGRRLGGVLVRRAIDTAVRAGRKSLRLACDERNLPAMALYKRFGFRRDFERVVYGWLPGSNEQGAEHSGGSPNNC